MGQGIVVDKDPYLIMDYSPYIRDAIKTVADDTEIHTKIIRAARKEYDIAKYIFELEKIYNNETCRDKTSLRLKQQRLIGMSTTPKYRLERFLRALDKNERMAERDYRMEQLYLALFDLNLKSDQFWYERVKMGEIPERKLIDEMFYMFDKNTNGHDRIEAGELATRTHGTLLARFASDVGASPSTPLL